MSRPTTDYTDLDAADRELRARIHAASTSDPAWTAFKAALSDEHRALLLAFLDREHARGERAALHAIRALHVVEEGANAKLRKKLDDQRDQITGLLDALEKSRARAPVPPPPRLAGPTRAAQVERKTAPPEEEGANAKLRKKLDDQRDQITGLLAALDASRKRAPATTPDLQAQLVRAEQQVAQLEAENARLREALRPPRRLQRQQVIARADWVPVLPPPRRTRPDEVSTAASTEVSRIARRVEEFVRKAGGKCTKSDVRAAMPDERHLSAVYRYLHAAQRLRVTGMTLEVWE